MRISRELTNLVRIGSLKQESGSQAEFDALMHSARVRLDDARNKRLALESRFDLAYNAAHALSLAALRWHGYRSDSRYTVFQALPHTLGLEARVWKVLAKAHAVRNAAEYEGHMELDEQLMRDLLEAAELGYSAAKALGPVSSHK
jgi:hypothetical protein